MKKKIRGKLKDGVKRDVGLHRQIIPPLPVIEKRKLYFDLVTPDTRIAFPTCECIQLIDLPRTNDAEHQAYLAALLQGMTDGTIEPSKDRREACELELRSRGLLTPKKAGTGLPEARVVELAGLLANFGKNSAHTLHNTTNQDPAGVEKFLREKSGTQLTVENKPGKLRPKYKRTFSKDT